MLTAATRMDRAERWRAMAEETDIPSRWHPIRRAFIQGRVAALDECAMALYDDQIYHDRVRKPNDATRTA